MSCEPTRKKNQTKKTEKKPELEPNGCGDGPPAQTQRETANSVWDHVQVQDVRQAP